MTNAVVPLRKSQAELLANVLYRVLGDEPRFTYVIPDAHARRAVLPEFFRAVIRASELSGETYTTPGLEGASVWIRPGRNLDIQRLLRTGSATMRSRLSWSSIKRSLALAAWTKRVRERIARGPHWYLAALAVNSSHGSRTLRRALIEPILSRADVEREFCYVEVFAENELPFFEQQGFRIQGGGCLRDCGPNYWVLMRAPA